MASLVLIGTSCHKNNNDGGTQQKDSTNIQSSPPDSIAAILYYITPQSNAFYFNRTPFSQASLVMLNPDGTLRWRNDMLTGPMFTAPAYSNGRFFLSGNILPDELNATQDPMFTTTVQAVDAATGKQIWTYRDQYLNAYPPVAFQDKVYLLGWNGFSQIDAATGKLIPLNDPPIHSPIAWQDSSVLYCLDGDYLQLQYPVAGFDLVTGKSTGLSDKQYNTPGYVVADGKRVYVITGGTNQNDPDRGMHLVALQKDGLKQLWENADHAYGDQLILQDSLVYAYTYGGTPALFAVGANDGHIRWQVDLPQTVMSINGLFIYKGALYAWGSVDLTHTFVGQVSMQTHTFTTFKTIDALNFVHPILSGNWMYGLLNDYNNAKIVLVDPTNFQVHATYTTLGANVDHIYILTQKGNILK
jgi:outer membrane protein assembly factor BamB